MNGFFQIIAGGAVGVAATLAAQYAPGLMAKPDTATAAEVWPAGTMVLSQTEGTCPTGWISGGSVNLGSAPMPATAGAIVAVTPVPQAWLCTKGAP